MSQLTHDLFVKDMSIRNPNVTITGSFTKVRNKIDCQCNICGHSWSPRADALRRGTSCPACARNKQRKSHEAFIEEIYQLLPSIRITEKYTAQTNKVKCLCSVCHTQWEAYPSNLLKGHGCPICGQQKARDSHRRTQEQFEQEVEKLNPNVIITEKYISRNQPIGCRCKICGHQWRPFGSNLLKGHGCPNCSKTQTSFMEQTILLFLQDTLGAQNVLSRDRTTIGKEIDIYIPSLQIGIEPGSWKWHQQSIMQDVQKYKTAKEHGIRLIIIYDKFDIKQNDKLLFDSDDVLVYTQYLGSTTEKETLINCVKHIFSVLGLTYNYSQKEEDIILLLAKKNSRKSKKDIQTELDKMGSRIKLLSEYTGYNDKMLCRCDLCEHEWEASPANLLAGKACPKCRRQKKVINTDTNQVYESITAAARTIGVHPNSLASVCKGKHKTCGGYHWSFA